MKEYDLISLGSGGAGFQAAMKCKQAGWNVALIDEGPFGGTCAVRGCIPKKVLAGVADIVDLNRRRWSWIGKGALELYEFAPVHRGHSTN